MGACNKQASISLLAIIAIAGGALLSACTPVITEAQAQKEIGVFMLDYIIRRQIGATATYLETSGQPWVKAPPDANIIVWAPPNKNIEDTSIAYLNTDQPQRVWWLEGKQLTEVTSDKAAAVEDYRQTHMMHPASDIRGWGYYEFGILSLSDGNQKAEVYAGISCGPLCGTGTIYTLERNRAGNWEITGSEMKWIS